MATEWFYQSLGQVMGPLKASDMIADVRMGKIGYDTLVKKDDSQWVPAHEVDGLLEAALRNIIEFRCPFCGTKIGKPPVECSGCDRRLEETYLIKAAFPSREKKAPANEAAAGPANGSAGTPANGSKVPVAKSVKDWAKSLFGKSP